FHAVGFSLSYNWVGLLIYRVRRHPPPGQTAPPPRTTTGFRPGLRTDQVATVSSLPFRHRTDPRRCRPGVPLKHGRHPGELRRHEPAPGTLRQILLESEGIGGAEHTQRMGAGITTRFQGAHDVRYGKKR
ncbi:hypothetical protein ACFU9V_09470, partial [Streptomyces sp. NPDC057557]